jgi:hypothetical protein
MDIVEVLNRKTPDSIERDSIASVSKSRANSTFSQKRTLPLPPKPETGMNFTFPLKIN